MPFEREVFFYLKENLPKGIDVSDEINRLLKERVEDLQKEKNVSSQNYSPIRSELVSYTTNKPDNYDNTTLDIYLLSNDDIREKIWNINSVKTLGEIERKGEVIRNVAKTKKLELIPIEKFKNQKKYLDK